MKIIIENLIYLVTLHQLKTLIMKKVSLLMMMVLGTSTFAQVTLFSNNAEKNTTMMKTNLTTSYGDANLEKTSSYSTSLIPFQQKGKFGFKNQNGKIIIPTNFSNVNFFAEDCRILNSPNEKIRDFGNSDYALVEQGGKDYRIDKTGKIVYKYNDEEMGKCPNNFQQQKYLAYTKNHLFGLIDREKYTEDESLQEFLISPKYEMIHVMEGNDLKYPMLIAAKGNKFGVIDIHDNIIIPFEFTDIKRNFSWKLANLFEATKDGRNYFYIDNQNKIYK